MKREKPKEKSRAALIIDGLIEPEDHEKGLLNLRKRKPFNEWSKEDLHAVAVKGGQAVQELHGERRTAKEALQNILTLKINDQIIEGADIEPAVAEKLKRDNPNATIYDLIQAVAVGRALDGNIRAAEYVRDTHGDQPVIRQEISANITTEQDRELMKQIAERLEAAPEIMVVKDIKEGTPEGPENTDK